MLSLERFSFGRRRVLGVRNMVPRDFSFFFGEAMIATSAYERYQLYYPLTSTELVPVTGDRAWLMSGTRLPASRVPMFPDRAVGWIGDERCLLPRGHVPPIPSLLVLYTV